MLNKFPKSFMLFDIISWHILTISMVSALDFANIFHIIIAVFLFGATLFFCEQLFRFWIMYLCWYVGNHKKANKLSLQDAEMYAYKTALNRHYGKILLSHKNNVIFYCDKGTGFFIEFLGNNEVKITDDNFEEMYMRIEDIKSFMKGK
ncbi:hypothetical protein phiOC_p193 [Ochrobactrum phage vB_OspM_OC]|nr:hypothetical protein phiOC_p193 [Ochrobactrum phage vB_OspM_OC]